MSLLAEVAARADVPIEGVVRVVTRQPVSRRIEQRVVDVLDLLEPEQLRALERLARAGRPEIVDPGSAPAAAGTAPGASDGRPAAGPADALTLRLGLLLEEVALCLNEMRRDHLADRQERVDDLAVLVELVSTGWRGVDRRLGRLERAIGRLEAAGSGVGQPRVAVPRELTRPAEAPAAPAAEAERPAEAPVPAAPAVRPVWRRVLAAATPVLIVGAIALALVAIELFASSGGEPRLQSAPEGIGVPARPQTSLSSTTGGPAGAPVPSPAARSGTVTTRPPARPGGSPTRVFTWTATPGTPYYLVRIFRGTRQIHEARPRVPRLVLSARGVFTPASYRWSVHPGIGRPGQNLLGPPIVDSAFVVDG